MKKNLLIILLGLLLYIPNVKAQNDNLNYAESIFDCYNLQLEYYSLIRKVLMNRMSDYPEVRFLIIPSFSVEEVVAIEKQNGKYFIVHHRMTERLTKRIWHTEKNKQKIKVNKKKVEISESDMKLYKKLFKKAITNRKKPHKNAGFDGVSYYFSVADRPLKTGVVWSPKSGSKMNRLKKVGYSLIALANETKNGKITELKTELSEQIKKLTIEITNGNNGYK